MGEISLLYTAWKNMGGESLMGEEYIGEEANIFSIKPFIYIILHHQDSTKWEELINDLCWKCKAFIHALWECCKSLTP